MPKPDDSAVIDDPRLNPQEEEKPELAFDDGEIAPHIASPFEEGEIDDDLRKELKALVDLVGNKDIAARRWEVESAWEARLFKRGYQYLLPRRGGGWIYPPLATDYSRNGRNSGRNFYGYETNIYATCEEIIIAALTRDIPRVEFRPMNPSCDADITAADAATRYAQVFGRSNNLRALQTQLASYMWTDDRVLIVTDHIVDAQRFGRESVTDDEPVVPESEAEESHYDIYVMRHGETELNRDEKLRGRSDSPLDEKGERQASRAGEWLRDKSVRAIITSPVERSLESAQQLAAALDVPVEVDDRLASLDIGDATGEKAEDGDDVIGGFFDCPDEKIPGSSESPNEFDARVADVLSSYLGQGPVVFVTHDSVLSSLFRQLRGGDMPPSSLVPPGGVAGIREGQDHAPDITPLFPATRPVSTGDRRGAPRGQEVPTVYGKLEHRVPMGSQTIAEMDHVMVAFELDVAGARARHPKYADKIKPGGGTSGENELDRIARINCQLALQASYVTGDSMVRDCTIQYVWFRPAFFMECKDVRKRAELFEKFPSGCKVTVASDVVVSARNEGMDDHLTLIHANPGSGQNRLALGGKLISVQKRLNIWVDLLDAYFVRTVPGTYVPEPLFDVAALADTPRSPGDYTPYNLTQLPEGRSIKDLIQVEELPLNNPAMPQMILYWIENLPQYLVHAMPTLFGAESNVDSGRALAIQRDMALGASGTPWAHIQEATASYFQQAVQLAGQCRTGPVEGMDESGNPIRVELAELKGRVLCYPESDANFPESWVQKQTRYEQMIITATQNQFMAGLLSAPQNARLAKDMAGFPELNVPGADAYEKQMGEFDILLKSGPLPNPVFQMMQQQSLELQVQIERMQLEGMVVPDEAVSGLAQLQSQMQTTPPLISSVPVDKDTDNHAVEAQSCLDWINDKQGRSMRYGTQDEREHFANVRLHYMEHKALVPHPQPPVKPPSLSINYKDLPPDAAATLLQDAGLETTGDDVTRTRAFQAELKKSSKIGGGPVPGVQITQ